MKVLLGVAGVQLIVLDPLGFELHFVFQGHDRRGVGVVTLHQRVGEGRQPLLRRRGGEHDPTLAGEHLFELLPLGIEQAEVAEFDVGQLAAIDFEGKLHAARGPGGGQIQPMTDFFLVLLASASVDAQHGMLLLAAILDIQTRRLFEVINDFQRLLRVKIRGTVVTHPVDAHRRGDLVLVGLHIDPVGPARHGEVQQRLQLLVSVDERLLAGGHLKELFVLA